MNASHEVTQHNSLKTTHSNSSFLLLMLLPLMLWSSADSFFSQFNLLTLCICPLIENNCNVISEQEYGHWDSGSW